MKKKIPYFKMFIVCFVLSLIISASPVHAWQDRIVKGTVTEKETGQPLAGVSVSIKGAGIGTFTDDNGQYQISVKSNTDVLVFSYVGKKHVEQSSAGLSVIDIAMEEDAQMLEEVYVGYMVQRKKDLTGAISIVNNADIAKNPSANAMKSLQGKLAGVHITTNGGNPAEGVNVQIRGLSSLSGSVRPLIVLDGMPIENLNLRDINTGDIESIQVLKDAASASIYGARASGGVILIQTKKAKSGQTKVEYSGSLSSSRVTQRPTLMNAEQYGTAMFRAYAYDEKVYKVPMTLPSTYDFTWHRDANGLAVLDAVKPAEWLNAAKTVRGSNTNWLDEILRPAIMTEHNLTVSKGADKSSSLFSLGYYDNQGTQIHTFFTKYSIRANTEYSLINNRLKVGENMAISYLNYKDRNELRWALIAPPAMPVYDTNGGWAGAAGFDDFSNPVRLLTDDKDNTNHFVKIIGNVFANLDIWKGLSARTQFGIDYGNAYNRALEVAWSETGGRNSAGENYVGSYQSHTVNYVWTNTLNYYLDIGKHSITALGGMEFTRFLQEGFSARREGIYLEDRNFAHIGVTTGQKYALGSSADEYVYSSLFAKATYAWDQKYLFSATLRRDGSSLFGANHRYGVFPAFSAGWRISQENFMKDLGFVSDIKLRASWGANGSVQGLPRGYTSTPFTTDYFSTSYPIAGNETGQLYSGYRRTWLGNPDLRWETTTQTDLGVDFSLFNSRLNGSFGYYFKKTADILVQIPYIAAMGEGGEPWINGANMNSRGIEIELGYKSEIKNGFQYGVSANVGTYKTRIVNIPQNAINKYPGNGLEDNVIGKTPNILYGLVADGIFKTQEEVDAHAQQTGKAIGRIRYKDLDGNGIVEELKDRAYIGVLDPKFFGGITLDAKYLNFDFNVFFQGVFGNMVNNQWKRESDLWNINVPSQKNHPTRLLDGWYFDNTDSDIPAPTNINMNTEQRLSSYFIENGSYLKLRNIELGFTLPKTYSDKLKMQHLRVFMSARNILTIKKSWGKDRFTSFDPEMPGYGYLTPSFYALGLNVTF